MKKRSLGESVPYDLVGHLTEINTEVIDAEYMNGRFDELIKTVDKSKAKEYFERIEQTRLNPSKVNIRTDKLLREFILSGGFEIE